MEKEKKKEVVEHLKSEFDRYNSVFLVHYQGLTVAEVSSLRKSLRNEAQAKFFVSKNSLIKIAIENTRYSNLEEYCSGPTALLFSDNPVDSSKILVKYSESNGKLKILAGSVENKKISLEQIQVLANLPSLDVLRGQLVSTMSQVASKLVNTLNAKPTSLIRVMEEHKKKIGE